MIILPVFPLWVIVLAGLALLALVVAGARSGWSWAATARRAVMVLLLVTVALRPVLPSGGESATASTDVDVFVVVDTTTSMVADDFDGATRLDGVKADIDALVEQFAGARFSMIGFDRVAVVRVPLTPDATAMLTAVDVLAPELSPYSDGTSISEANDLLARSLEQAQELHPERVSVVVYLGDGEQTRDADPESFEAAGALADGGVVLGYGTELGGAMVARVSADAAAAPEPVMDFSVTPAVPAISRIDEENLESVALELGVEYVHRLPGEPMVTVPLPELDAGDALRESSLGTVRELYWVPAAFLFALFVWEGAVAVAALASTRRRGADSR